MSLAYPNPSLLREKGGSKAHRENWSRRPDPYHVARFHLSRAAEGGSADLAVWHRLAVLAAFDADRAAYRRGLVERFARTNDTDTLRRIEACVLADDAGVDYARLIEQGRELCQRSPGVRPYRLALGKALYRAGRYDEAVRELQRAVSGPGGTSTRAALLLSVAYHRAGKAALGGAWLDMGLALLQEEEKWLGTPGSLWPEDWIDLAPLRREAEQAASRGKR